MGGGGPGWPKGTSKVAKHVTKDKKQLAQIAKILGIKAAPNEELWAAELYTKTPKRKGKSGGG